MILKTTLLISLSLLLMAPVQAYWRPYFGVPGRRITYIHPYISRYGIFHQGTFRQRPYYNPMRRHYR